MPAFRWTDYLQLAKTLAASDDEAALRSAISRAYYAALHGAAEACVENRILIPLEVLRGTKIDRSHHARVIAALARHDNPRVQRAGELLDAMRVLRNKVDYELTFRGDVASIAHEVLTRAERIRTELDAFC